MAQTIASIVVILLAALLGFAATRPDTFRVQRTAQINAPPEKIFPFINDLHQWSAWSPYERKDPAMKKTLTGAANGPGAAYAWDGNNEVGQGRMEITAATPPSAVTLKLDFAKPFEAHNLVEFTLAPDGEATNVTWAMHGPSPYIAKLMGLFFSMDKMVGTDFESGLANLKTVAER